MKVRFTLLTFSPEKIAEAKRIYNTEIAPVIRSYKGSKDVMFLQSEKNAEQFISCSIWESKEDLEAFEESQEYQQVIGKVKELAQKVEQQYYEVV